MLLGIRTYLKVAAGLRFEPTSDAQARYTRKIYISKIVITSFYSANRFESREGRSTS